MSTENLRRTVQYNLQGQHFTTESKAINAEITEEELVQILEDNEISYLESKPYERPPKWRKIESEKPGDNAAEIQDILSDEQHQIQDISLVRNEKSSWGKTSGEAPGNRFDFYARIEYNPEIGSESTRRFTESLDTFSLSNYISDYFRGVIKIGVDSEQL